MFYRKYEKLTICNKEQLKNISNYLNNNNITIYNGDFTKFIDTIKDKICIFRPSILSFKSDSCRIR